MRESETETEKLNKFNLSSRLIETAKIKRSKLRLSTEMHLK